MALDYKQKWNECLDIIRDNVGDEKFDIWFSHAKAVDYDESRNELTLNLPTLYYKDVYENPDGFYNIISKSLQKKFGMDVRLSYAIGIISDDPESKVTCSSEKQSDVLAGKTARGRQRSANPGGEVIYEDVDPQLNLRYNFDNYCLGDSNKLPHTIARYIAEHPDDPKFNPFFLYGAVGVGKTHLIQAIGIKIKEQNPQSRVLYVTMRHFINQYRSLFIEDDDKKKAKSKTQKEMEFIDWYQHLDVLLIDDIQELSGKEGTMNALFPIFNHLYHSGKKLIFTCDRPPMMLDGVTDRLIDRFKSGVVEELQKPDLQLRKKILEYKSRINGLELPPRIIDMVAESVTGSVRELEGVVLGILTRAINLNTPITEQLAYDVISRSVKKRTKSVSFDTIVDVTVDHYNVNADGVYTKSRMRPISDARQMIMYLAHKHMGMSSTAIGRSLNREHATVLHGIKNVEERLSVERNLQEMVDAIEADLFA